MKKMIVIAGPLPPPVHGASRVTAAVRDRLVRAGGSRGFGVIAVSTAGTEKTNSLQYHYRRLQAHAKVTLYLIFQRCRGFVVLYLGGAGGAGLWYQIALVGAARLLRCRVIFHHHSYSYLGDSRYRSIQAICLLMGRSDTHILLTPEMLTRFTQQYKTNSGAVACSNASLIEPVRAATRCVDDTYFRLIHVSNLSEAKGTDDVVNTFRLLRERGIRVHLTLVGPVLDDKIGKQIEALADMHGDTFEFCGPMDSAGVNAELDKAHLFLFPSKYKNEAQPMVVLEALSRGLPVLATARGALRTMLPTDWLIEDVTELPRRVEEMQEPDWRWLSDRALASFVSAQALGVDVVNIVLR